MQKPAPKGFARNDIPALLLTLLTLGLTWPLFRFFMVPWNVQVNFDEGSEAAVVERVIGGHWLPYIDAQSIRGPFLYWTQAIFTVLTGRFEFAGTRWLALCGACATVLATSLAGWAAGWPLAGAFGGAFYIFVIATYTEAGGGMGVVAESVGIVYVTTAFFLVAYALYRAHRERTRIALLALGGCFVAMAGLTKQTEAITCLPIALWILAHSWGEAEARVPASDWRRWSPLTHRLVPFAAGGLALVGLVLLRYAVVGKLHDFFYWSLTFGTQMYMQPFEGKVLEGMQRWFLGEPWAVLGVALALTVAFGRPLAALRFSGPGLRAGLRSTAFELGVGLTAICSLIGSALPQRFWPHYFMPVYPFFGLSLGLLIERALRRGARVPWPAQSLVLVVFGGFLLSSALTRLNKWQKERAHGSWANPRPDPVCTEIDRVAGANKQPIFVWGTAGDLYITCQRAPVSMFTATMTIAGIVPPSWTPTPALVAPGIQDILRDELESRKPVVILDHSMAPGARMQDFPIFSQILDLNYCRLSTIDDLRGRAMTLYARNDLPACKAANP
jgi:hypothetical protein